MRSRALTGQRATVAAFAAAVAVLFSGNATGEATARYRPVDGEQTILVLPAALSRPPPTPSNDWQIATDQAEQYLRLARTTGDPRYFGRAKATIRPWLDRPAVSPSLDIVAADLAQQRHQFAEARRLLDRALTADPRNLQARLMRANLALLAGEFDAARSDCRSVLQAGTPLPGVICLASAMTGPGALARSRSLLASLDQQERAPTELSHWRLLIQADLALRAADTEAAAAFLERAHALEPAHDETRARLAQALLERGEAARAIALTADSNGSPALLMVRMRAADRTDAAIANIARRDLESLLAAGRQRGAAEHLREEAALALHTDGEAERALALALRNFEIQKDTPDLRLLLETALAAGDRATLQSVRDWLDATGFEDRVVEAQLRAAGA